MLQLSPPTPILQPLAGEARSDAEELDLRWLYGAIRRRLWSIALVSAIGLTLAAAYVAVRPSNYMAFTQLQLTNLRLTFSRDDAFYAESQSDPTFLETQIQIMRSGKIALAVVDSMGLAKPQEADAPDDAVSTGFSQWVSSLRATLDTLARPDQNAVAPSPEGKAADDARREALKKLQRSYSVERVGLSNIVEIRFSATDRDLAARGANELALAYIADQQAARIEAAQSASIWLRERLRDVGPRARIVAAAVPPLDKSDPRGVLIVALGGVLGGVLGVALALARQFFDRTVRTPEQAEKATAAECLGIVPRLRSRRRPSAAEPQSAIAGGPPLLNEAVRAPSGDLARALRNAKVAIDDSVRGRGPRRIGVTSTYQGEGVSTFAANLARFLASQGERVLLVDCNARSPRLSMELAAEPRETGGDAVLVDGSLTFLPRGGQAGAADKGLIWASEPPAFLKTAGEDFDYVVCDLPALASIGDVRGAALHLDSFLLVLKWAEVDAEHLRVAVRSAGAFREKLAGFIINRASRGGLRQTASPSAAFFLKKQARAGRAA